MLIKNFQYDVEDHVISYASYNSEGALQYNYHAVFKNDILVESTETDFAGNITDQYIYDSTYGDTLSSCYTGSDGSRYESIYSYYEDYYENDWRSLSYAYRTVTRYSATDGKKIKEDRYDRENANSEWVYESTAVYSVNMEGNTVKDTTNVDGSTRRDIMDENGNNIYNRATNADGTFSYACSKQFDSAGREIRLNQLNEEGNVESYTLHEYNAQDRQKDTTYKADGSFWYAYEYVYDSEGKIARLNRLDENGKTESYTLYEYDENGDDSHLVSYGADGTKNYEVYYRTLSDGTRQHKYFWYRSDGSLREEEDWE